MSEIDVLNDPKLQEIGKKYKTIQQQRNSSSWNIFNLSSYNNQIENFHSDIIASLLDPDGAHAEGDKYLRKFIEFLNNLHGLNINSDDFMKSRVDTETMGRIDVGIFDEDSHKCIIIENKMNNAPDMEEQLLRYYNGATDKGYMVEAIVYLSIDGMKKAPMVGEHLLPIIRNVPAFNESQHDLINGWLIPCKILIIKEDSSSLIFQYIKL